MSYLVLKYLHLLSLVLLFGTGLGSAWYKFMADRRGDLAGLVCVNSLVVRADWLFTLPTVILQPITGLGMAHVLGLPLHSPWIIISLLLYTVAALCWLPVIWLQIRMRDLSWQSLATAQPLPERYHLYARYWFWLGVPAFGCMLLILFLMIFKPTGGLT
ncbi:DUF2269 family protein [Thiolapillus sp.]